jgi:peroxiredoxin family protein
VKLCVCDDRGPYGLNREDLIDDVGDPAGPATALGRTKRSAISVFI